MFEFSLRLYVVALVWANSAIAQVIVNEFLPSPTGSQEEYIELLNIGEAPVPVAEIFVRDERADWVPVGSDSPVQLDPGELLVLSAAEQPAWPQVEFVRTARWPSLNNSGDSVAVRVGEYVTDRVGYGDNDRGRSLERIDPDLPGHLAGNWAPSCDDSGGTPGRINSRYHPDETPPRLLAAEYDPPASLLLWLSESIDPRSVSDLRIEVDGASSGILAVEPHDARILVSLVDATSPVAVAAGGASDYAGHPMPDTTLAVARPVSPGEMLLTELLVEAGAGLPDLPEFVELASVVDHPVSLRDAYLTIGRGPEPDVIPLSAPDSTRILDPGEILIVYGSPASEAVAAHTRSLVESSLPVVRTHVELVSADASDLALRNTGDLVRLTTGNGTEIDATEYTEHMNDARFRDHRGRSIRRVQTTGSNAPQWASTLEETGTTPGRRGAASGLGSLPRRGDLAFSELMPRPLSDPVDGRPDQQEYIEIANGSERTISLNGLQLSGPVRDDGNIDVRRIGFQPLRLQPGDVALFYELPDAIGDSAEDQFASLADAFPIAYPDGIGFGQHEASLGRGAFLTGGRGLLIPVRGVISLNNNGETLRLLGPDGVVIDSIAFTPAMHHPAVADPTGRALERTVLSLAPLRLGDWSTSLGAGGGTPGLLPRRPGPPPSYADTGPTARLHPGTISPDGDGVDDRAVILAENLKPGTLIRADIFDIDGRLVRTLVPGTIAGDTFSTGWSGLDDVRRPVARGFYIVLIRTYGADSGRERAFKLPVAVAR